MLCWCWKAEEAKVKILEVTGDRVDNKSKLEVIRQEEEIIRRENEERKKEEEAEKLAREKVLAEAAAEAEVGFRSNTRNSSHVGIIVLCLN